MKIQKFVGAVLATLLTTLILTSPASSQSRLKDGALKTNRATSSSAAGVNRPAKVSRQRVSGRNLKRRSIRARMDCELDNNTYAVTISPGDIFTREQVPQEYENCTLKVTCDGQDITPNTQGLFVCNPPSDGCAGQGGPGCPCVGAECPTQGGPKYCPQENLEVGCSYDDYLDWYNYCTKVENTEAQVCQDQGEEPVTIACNFTGDNGALPFSVTTPDTCENYRVCNGNQVLENSTPCPSVPGCDGPGCPCEGPNCPVEPTGGLMYCPSENYSSACDYNAYLAWYDYCVATNANAGEEVCTGQSGSDEEVTYICDFYKDDRTPIPITIVSTTANPDSCLNYRVCNGEEVVNKSIPCPAPTGCNAPDCPCEGPNCPDGPGASGDVMYCPSENFTPLCDYDAYLAWYDYCVATNANAGSAICTGSGLTSSEGRNKRGRASFTRRNRN